MEAVDTLGHVPSPAHAQYSHLTTGRSVKRKSEFAWPPCTVGHTCTECRILASDTPHSPLPLRQAPELHSQYDHLVGLTG